MATWAIGDVHGHCHALEALLAKIRPDVTSCDQVVFLGDLIDRGPDSLGAIQAVLSFRNACPARVTVVRGNHEEAFLATVRDFTKHSWILGMEGLATVASYCPVAADVLRAELRRHGARLVLGKVRLPYEVFLDSVPREHVELLRRSVPSHRTPDALCVHDADPERPPEGSPVVYGHRDDAVADDTGRRWPRITGGRAYGLDASGTGVVLALRLPDRAVFRSD